MGHPLDGPTRAKIDAARKAQAAKTAAHGAKAAGGISASVPDFAAAMNKEAAGQAAGDASGEKEAERAACTAYERKCMSACARIEYVR